MNHDASNLFVHQRQEHFFEGGLFGDCFVKHKTEMFGDLGIPLTHHGEVVVSSLYTVRVWTCFLSGTIFSKYGHVRLQTLYLHQ